MNSTIERIVGRRVWDSRGRPTIEVDVHLAGGAMGRAIAPAGASRGSGEALDRRDGGAAFGGLDVRQALAAVDAEIGPALRGCDATDQAAIDAALIARDGTRDKSRIGANTMVAASMAVAHAGAAARGLPLWQHLGGGDDARLPLPEIQIFGGGAHAGRRVDVQDFMVMPVGASTFAEALDWSAEVYRAAGQIMSEAGRLRGVADEGGFWPAFDDNEQALEWLLRAIERAGYRPGEQMAISLDVAASQLGHGGRYRLARARGGAKELDRDEMAAMLLDWLQRYPIVAFEDPMGEDDAEGFARFTRAAGDRVQVIGDDFLVTNAARIDSAATFGACNAVLIKPNQAGTLTEAKSAWDTARGHGWGALVSARSGETEDTTIVHLAVGWGVGQLKVGSFSRSERMAKWNEGLRLAEQLQDGRLPSPTAFPWASGHRSSLR